MQENCSAPAYPPIEVTVSVSVTYAPSATLNDAVLGASVIVGGARAAVPEEPAVPLPAIVLIVATRVLARAAALSLPTESQRIAINAIPTRSMVGIRPLRSIGRGFNCTEARCPWRFGIKQSFQG